MQKITIQVEGMACGMCETHVNDAVRKAFPIKKVTSSHKKKETVIFAETDIDEAALRSVVEAAGYSCPVFSDWTVCFAPCQHQNDKSDFARCEKI